MGNNYSATTDPTASNGTPTYNVGDFWLNTNTGKMFQCRDNTSGSAKWISDNPVVNVRDFGALGEDGIDYTSQVNAAKSACAPGGTLYFPAGIYDINLTIDTPLNLRGEGMDATVLRSKNDNAYAVVYSSTNQASGGTISDLRFSSIGSNRGGVQLGANTYSTNSNQEYNGNHSFNRVSFVGCSVGVHKRYGEIYNEFNFCKFQCTKYGIYAWNATVVPPPAAPSTTTVSGGTFSARVCWVRTTYSTAQGTTSGSVEVQQSVAANHLLKVNSPAAPTVGLACTGWNVYATNVNTGWETKQNTTPIAIGTDWTEPTSGLTTDGAAPGGNTSGMIMHSGCDYYTNCVFSGATKAAIYYDSVYQGGQVAFRTCIIQGNQGFGVYLNSLSIAGGPPITFDNVWWEANATATSAGISTTGPDGTETSYTPIELFAQSCKAILIRDGTVPQTTLANNTSLVLRHVGNQANGRITKDASSVVVAFDGVASIAVEHANDLYFDSVLFGLNAGGFAPVVVTKPRSVLTHRYTSEIVYSNSFSTKNSQSIGALTSHLVADGTLFDACQELVIPANNNGNGPAIVTGLFNAPLGKYCVWTLDIKVMSANAPASFYLGYNTALGAISDFTGNANGARWYSYACITSSPIAAGVNQLCGLCIYPNTANSVTVRYGAFQVLAFDALQDALQFLLSGMFALTGNPDRPRALYSDQAPSTGTWAVGDTVYSVSPTSGGYIGWVCVTAGTPGTWKTFGAVS